MKKQWDAKLNVSKPRYEWLMDKEKLLVTAFAMTREEAIDDVIKFAKAFGFDEATVDHIVGIGYR